MTGRLAAWSQRALLFGLHSWSMSLGEGVCSSTGTEEEADEPSGSQGHPLGLGIYLAATARLLSFTNSFLFPS